MLALSLTAMDKQSYNSKNGKEELVRRRIKNINMYWTYLPSL